MPAIHSRPLRGVLAVVAACALAAGLAPAPGAAAAPAAAPMRVADACDQTPGPGHFSCFAQRRVDLGFTTRRELKAAADPAPPDGYGPSDLQSAYALAEAAAGNGSDQTVFIVDAYDDPKAEADLAVYRDQYKLPPCTSANGCFRKLNQDGQPGPLPAPDEGWAGEIALDLAMVSAVCPLCKITLIESNDNGENLFRAVKEATTLGARFVSLSWGGGEDGTEPSYDAKYFKSTGVVYTAASGDDAYAAGVSYPASSPRVVAVGGTHLTHASNARTWSESVWSNLSGGTGSGCSSSEAKPAWQSVIASSTCTKRAITDVSAVADPATGVAVYFSYGQGNDGWAVFGGTSASTPIIAAAYALAGPPSTSSHPGSLPYVDRADLNDVTLGSNGKCTKTVLCRAGPGWDGPTGLGTPKGTGAFTADDDPASTVSLTNPGARAGNVGRATSLQISARDSAFDALTYHASGLPSGLVINTASGRITGRPTRAGSYSVTVSAADAAGASNSASFTWTIAASCSGNKFTNSGFESGRAGWTMSSNRVYRSSSSARRGTHVTRLDGYGRTHTDRIARTITIPAGCKATVRYYLRVSTTDTSKLAHDKLTVAVNGVVRQTYSSVNSKHYALRTMDATRYAGKRITISWTGRENSSRATAFWIDDVTFWLS